MFEKKNGFSTESGEGHGNSTKVLPFHDPVSKVEEGTAGTLLTCAGAAGTKSSDEGNKAVAMNKTDKNRVEEQDGAEQLEKLGSVLQCHIFIRY